MIGYVCKYTPIEIFEFLGEECEKIEPEINQTPQADAFFHPNMCAYSKIVLEACMSGKYDKLIFTNCCDSIRRVYDLICSLHPEQWVYMLELPRKISKGAVDFYKNEIKKLIDYYEASSQKKFDRFAFEQYISHQCSSQKEKSSAILLLGARTNKTLKRKIQNSMPVLDLTCSSSENRRLSNGCEYEKSILNQFPCMRMDMYWEAISKMIDYDKVKGIIYHTIKFCDYYAYGYAWLKNENLKLLKLETDYLNQSSGQIETRLEAFIESLNLNIQEKKMKKAAYNLVIGIDSGSTSTNLVLMNDKKEIVAYHIIPTGAKSIESANKAYKELLTKAKISSNAIDCIVATGYGRSKIPFVDTYVTEISCHGKGANYFDHLVRTIIDIGGQDSKVIRIDEKGDVLDFAMNDKCAAGTGKFLEMMSTTLEMSLDEMGEAYIDSREDLEITSMCTVFAESEVISLIAENKDKADIIAALNRSTISRVLSMLTRMGKEGSYMMTGGVAKNKGIIHAIEEALKENLTVPQEPQIVGAVGACLFALEK